MENRRNNSDGTIKLITESAMTYMPWDSTGNTDYAKSEIRTWLNDEFLPTLNEDMIAETTFNYTGVSESLSIGEINMLQDKVGLLSAIDFVGVISLDLATGNFGYMSDNYLMNGLEWWLSSISPDTGNIWRGTPKLYVNEYGNMSVGYTPPIRYGGIRPVVNLLSTTNFIDGDGSKENPYVIEGEEAQGEIYQYNENLVTELSNLSEVDMNGTRYVTGLVEDNYVWYSGKLWRIVALNGDGTVKLVTQNAMTSISWDINNSNNYSTSQMRRWLNNEFLPTIDEKLVATSTWDYTYGTLDEKVGLLTINEFLSTGGSNYNDTANTYLNTKYWWWLMTPYTYDGASNVWNVVGLGGVDNGDAAAYSFGARPSVNLISDIRISGGTGEVGNPYTIEGDKATGETSELLSNRINGEYVNFNNTLYRIVGVETINGKKLTKITMADYSVNKNTIVTEVQFGATGDSVGATFTPTAGIGLYLKNWYEGSEVSETSRAMVATAEEDGVVWYQGPTDGIGYDYTLSKTGTPISATIGLPYYGEMFSTQQGLGYEESIRPWFMTKYDALGVWAVNVNGNAGDGGYATNSFGARPSVYLKSNIRLGDTNGDGSVGTGQINSPYELVLE